MSTQKKPASHPPTPEQQLVLGRIAAQRERVGARRQAHARQLASTQEAPAAVAGEASLVERLLQFTREHPSVLALVAAAAVAAGPRRLLRWAGVVAPLILRNKR